MLSSRLDAGICRGDPERILAQALYWDICVVWLHQVAPEVNLSLSGLCSKSLAYR
jgi:hypothetical protein